MGVATQAPPPHYEKVIYTLLTLYLDSSVVQGSTAHSSNNPGVLYYQTPQCGTDIKSTSL